MLTVAEAARRAGRSPQTIRRWIRDGKLPVHDVGTHHLIEEVALRAVLDDRSDRAPLPLEWQDTAWGGPMPDVVASVRRVAPRTDRIWIATTLVR